MKNCKLFLHNGTPRSPISVSFPHTDEPHIQNKVITYNIKDLDPESEKYKKIMADIELAEKKMKFLRIQKALNLH